MDTHKNFAYGVTAVAPSPAGSGTSLTLQTGQGALFPAVPFNVTVWPTGTAPLASNAEIVRVTAVAGDVLTIARNQEGTSTRLIAVGDQVAAAISNKTLADIEELSFSGRSLARMAGVTMTTLPGAILTNVNFQYYVAPSGGALIRAIHLRNYDTSNHTPNVQIVPTGQSAALKYSIWNQALGGNVFQKITAPVYLASGDSIVASADANTVMTIRAEIVEFAVGLPQGFVYAAINGVIPAVTTWTTLYTCPAGKFAIVDAIVVTSLSGASTTPARVSIQPSGQSINEKHVIMVATGLAAGETRYPATPDGPIILKAGDVIGHYLDAANTHTFSGTVREYTL